MRIIMMILISLSCMTAWPVAAQETGAPDIRLLDWTGDHILNRVVVPSNERPQGEVQLIQRRDLLVVQTLLSSRILKRVVATIDIKENQSWPAQREGHADSLRYRDELYRAAEKSWEAFRQRGDPSQEHQALAIEFIAGPEQSFIALSLPQLSKDGANLKLIGKQTLKLWQTNGSYVRENIVEIVMDSFHLGGADARELLKPLWPGRQTLSPY